MITKIWGRVPKNITRGIFSPLLPHVYASFSKSTPKLKFYRKLYITEYIILLDPIPAVYFRSRIIINTTLNGFMPNEHLRFWVSRNNPYILQMSGFDYSRSWFKHLWYNSLLDGLERRVSWKLAINWLLDCQPYYIQQLQ